MQEDTLGIVDQNKHHEWEGMAGKVTLYAEYPLMHLELDRGEHPFCALDAAQTTNFLKVLTTLNRMIWEQGGQQHSQQIRHLTEIFDSNYQWETPNGTLFLGFNHAEKVVGMRILDPHETPKKEVPLTLEQTVELIQTLELFLAGQLA